MIPPSRPACKCVFPKEALRFQGRLFNELQTRRQDLPAFLVHGDFRSADLQRVPLDRCDVIDIYNKRAVHLNKIGTVDLLTDVIHAIRHRIRLFTAHDPAIGTVGFEVKNIR